MAESKGRIMIAWLIARLRRRRPMTLEEYRAYRDQQWLERLRRIDQGPLS